MERNFLCHLPVFTALLVLRALAAEQSEQVLKLDPYVVTGIKPVLKIAEHPMVEPRFGAAVVAAGDFLYIIGGSNSDGTRLDTVERVNLRTGQASQWTKLKVARRHHRAVVTEGKIYVIGGTSGGDAGKVPLSMDERGPIDSLSEELSDYAGDDQPIADSLPPRMINVPPENQLKKPDSRLFAIPYHYQSTVEIIDLATGGVTQGPAMPVAKALFGCVLVDGRILVIGGQKRKGGNIFCTNTTEVLDLRTLTWGKGINMPTPRRCTATLVDGFVMVLGGYRGSKSLTTVEVFNPREKVWRRLPELTETINPSATVWVGNYVFLFGDQEYLTRQLVYDLRSKQLVSYPLSMPNSDFAAAVQHEGKIYVVGGASIRQHITNEGIQVFAPTVEAEPPSAQVSPPQK